ncbi:MAG: hypothetical protein J7621_14585 [Niastella sp.]|nr:hypothetical protein [Niastella sp.]
MKQINNLALLLLLGLLFSCSKNKPETDQPGEKPFSQVKLPHGNPIGEITTAQIGTAGGSLISKDGILKITVPAGAVSQTTTFSVQEVENVLEGKPKAYRLLPENASFSKPITLTYYYGSVEPGNTNPDFLFLAFQDKDGYFFSANRTVGNRQQQTLTVTTTHFSDWTFFAEYELYFPDDHELINGELHLGETEEARIALMSRKLDKKEDVSELPEVHRDPIVHQAIWDYAPKIGTMTKIEGFVPGVTYKAPAKVTKQEHVYINVTLNGNLGTDNLGKPVQQMQLRLPIVLDPDGYFLLTENGVEMTASDVSAVYYPGFNTQISAFFFNGYTINCYTYGRLGGGFPYGMHGQGTVATIAISELSEQGASYMTYYPKDCERGGEAHSKGEFTVKSVPAQIGGYFEGEFTATLYHFDYCKKNITKNLSGKFRIRRTE